MPASITDAAETVAIHGAVSYRTGSNLPHGKILFGWCSARTADGCASVARTIGERYNGIDRTIRPSKRTLYISHAGGGEFANT